MTKDNSIYRQGLPYYGITIFLCIISFAVMILFRDSLDIVLPQSDYVIIHLLLELISVIVSFSIFIVAWYGYGQHKNKLILLIGTSFFAVGLFNLLHTLSFKGMPSFITPNTISKAALYWSAAALVAATAIFVTSLLPPRIRLRFVKRFTMLAISIALPLLIVTLVTLFPSVSESMYRPGVGLTPLKIRLESLVIFLSFLSFFTWGRRRDFEIAPIIYLQVAMILTIFSEMGFLFFKHIYDTYSLFRHILKIIAYYFLLRSLFVSSLERPYSDLLKLKEAFDRASRRNAELYARSEKQRRELENSVFKIGEALALGTRLDETLKLVTDLTCDLLQVDKALVSLIDRKTDLPVIAAQKGVNFTNDPSLFGKCICSNVLAEKKAFWLGDIEGTTICHPEIWATNIKSLMCAPIVREGRSLGALEMFSDERDRFTASDAEVLTYFANQVAVTISSAITIESEHEIAQTLQKSLLPPIPPPIPSVDMTVRYVPASEIALVGGDLYDVFTLVDNKLVVLIGDVCGHGLRAATSMSVIQHMIRGLLIQGLTPGKTLAQVNDAIFKQTPKPEFITALLGVVDIPKKQLIYSNAGHPMPVMTTSDGIVKLMKGSVNIPLGIFEESHYDSHRVGLKKISSLLFYTDGLTDAGTKTLRFEISRVMDVCADQVKGSPDVVLDDLLGKVEEFSKGSIPDDIAMVMIKFM